MKNFFSFLILTLGMLLFNTHSFAQQIQLTNPSMTPAQAVQNVLLGSGVNAFNVTFNGSPASANTAQNSVRHFNNGGGTFPIAEGVLLNTFSAPSVNNDSDLNAIDLSGNGVTNGVIVEFDFVPSGDTLSFNYMFASSEYSSYTCSDYNDVFGFFISGPGISGPYSNNSVNLAIIPGSDTIPGNPNGTPVGINTVNSGVATGGNSTNCSNVNPNWLIDAQYWTNSYNSTMGGVPGGYNGATVLLSANAKLVCNDTFHIKMAISNVDDTALNSGVFLEANSFSSEGVDISIEANTSTSDTMLIEGCSEGTVYFSRPASQSNDSLSIIFTVGGTATQGDDFPVLAPGDSIVLLPGQTKDSLTISPVQDNIPEGLENIIISAYTINNCGDTIYTEGIIWIDDEPHSIVTSTDTTVLCSSDSIPLSALTEDNFHFEPYTYSWNEIGTQDTLYGNPIIGEAYGHDTVVQYLVTSTDACGFQYTDTATITLHQTLNIDSLKQFIATCGESDGAVVGYGSGFTGTPSYIWTSSIVDTIPGDSVSATAWLNRSAGWYYFSIEDDVCKVLDSILVEQTPPPEASFEANPDSGMSPLDVTFVNTSEAASSYYWDFGNGVDTTVSNTNNQYQTYIEEGTYTVTLITQEGTCTDQTSKEITVVLPVLYDLPNIFTPNGDGENDFFTINAKNAKALHVVIVNRWGNVLFESNDVNFTWDGTTKSGQPVDDGTYFYKFTITDHSGTEKQEHGFVHVVRNK